MGARREYRIGYGPEYLYLDWFDRHGHTNNDTVDTSNRRTSPLLGPDGAIIKHVDVDKRPKKGFQPSERGK